MAELWHSSSMSGRSVSPPRKRDDVASPLVPENLLDDGHDRHSRDRFRSFFSTFQSMFPFFGVDDTRFHPHTSKISLCLLLLVILAGLISVFSILNGLKISLVLNPEKFSGVRRHIVEHRGTNSVRSTLAASQKPQRSRAMEFQTAKPNARMPRNEKLSLDHYLSFIATHKQLHLTVNLLNQIIDMHGFKKIHNTGKKVLIDAVNSMELMDPSRSTLNEENVSSCAHMTLEEAIKDLADLKWQECCVTSIQTLNSVNYDLVVHNTDAEAESSKPKLKQKTRSRKRRKFLTLGAAGGDSAATATATATAAAAHGCGGSNLITETERTRITNFNDDDFGATGGDCSEYSSTFLPIAPY